jgi:hypothetical protein
MIETHPALDGHPRPELATTSYAHLAPAERPAVQFAPEPAPAERPTFWNRPARVATVTALDLPYPNLAYPDLTELDRADPADHEAPATWWPAILVVLLAAMAGLALFGVI